MSKIVGVTVGTPLSLSRIKQEIAPDIKKHEDKNDNPHGVTKDQVGLGNVNNTSDMDKPVSTAQANAIADAKKAGTDAHTAANTAQSTANSAQTTANNALPKSGGTVTGALTVQTPTESGHAANKQYVDGKYLSVQIIVPASSWSDSAPYTQTVSVSDLLATDKPHLFPVYSDTLDTAITQHESWAMVSTAVSNDGSLTLKCFEEKPAADLTLQLEVNR